MLSEFGNHVVGVEMNEKARVRAEERGIATVMSGYLPDHMPTLPPQTCIAAFDVLEHVEQDTAALQALYHQLSNNGLLLLTVPALPWMWGRHDVRHHHFRRYTRGVLKQRLEAAGFHVERISYFNTLLSPLAIMIRLIHKLSSSDGKHCDVMPFAWLNRLFTCIFSAEKWVLARGLNFPIGISLIAVGRRV